MTAVGTISIGHRNHLGVHYFTVGKLIFKDNSLHIRLQGEIRVSKKVQYTGVSVWQQGSLRTKKPTCSRKVLTQWHRGSSEEQQRAARYFSYFQRIVVFVSYVCSECESSMCAHTLLYMYRRFADTGIVFISGS